MQKALVILRRLAGQNYRFIAEMRTHVAQKRCGLIVKLIDKRTVIAKHELRFCRLARKQRHGAFFHANAHEHINMMFFQSAGQRLAHLLELLAKALCRAAKRDHAHALVQGKRNRFVSDALNDDNTVFVA